MQVTVLAAFAAMIIPLLQSNSRREKAEPTEGDDATFDDLVELIQQRISHVKGLHAAWVEFCAGLGVSASDVDTMTGMPFMGGMGRLEIVQENVGEIPPDPEYQRECLDHMRSFWKTKLEDRHAV